MEETGLVEGTKCGAAGGMGGGNIDTNPCDKWLATGISELD
jgi:hypothetical protein